MKKIDIGVKDDSDFFAVFELFDKLEKRPDALTSIERLALQGFGVDI